MQEVCIRISFPAFLVKMPRVATELSSPNHRNKKLRGKSKGCKALLPIMKKNV
jgi:hypothetical protein